MLFDGLNDAFSGQHSGWHTENLVSRNAISRSDQDAWAQRSQQRFSAARAGDKFAAEIVAVEVPGRKGPTFFDKDEHNRSETTAASLAKLKPAFRKDGNITAGNAPGLNTRAAAMIVAERAWAETNGLLPIAKLVSDRIGAVEPGLFDVGPVPVVRQALARDEWNLEDVQRVEINEAFTAISLACQRSKLRGEHCQCRRRGDCPRPSYRRLGCCAGHTLDALDAARWARAGHRDLVYRRRPGHRIGLEDALTNYGATRA